ncbi:hypothetical protein OESDEN_04896 [Oesophagostomum dentatum]|uniref:tRNA (adenine(58)-N(1))-methyltransferase non-catalytic subunit TRM6 n=1 Tax=Oesophagostomum dentatum TaxID=61180 RepID=A0A0B1TH99_OESDE|nr:hypothetical protein OESDEN_04896 [Oesophagostomum dentatum]
MNERVAAVESVEKGSYVVVQKVGGEHIRVMRLSPKQKVLIEKLKFESESVFGHPYGLFEVSSGKAVPVCASQLVQDEGVGDIELRDVNGSADSESTVLEECNQENPELNPAQIYSTFLPVRIAALLGTAKQADDTKENAAEEEPMDEEDDAAEGTSLARRAERLAREKRGLTLLEEGIDAVIIATRTVDPVSLLEVLFPKLRPCGSVVVYGPHMEPIVDAYRWLMDHDCVNVRLSEQMFRIHQPVVDAYRWLMDHHCVNVRLSEQMFRIHQASLRDY